jgi:hypothetical protein
VPVVGPWELLVLGVGALAAVMLVWSIFKAAVNREEIDEWATRRGLTLTEGSRPVIADYLVRTRQYRLKGALIGLVVPFQLGVVGLEMALGYLLGALYAEFTQERPVDSGTRAAALAPRAVEDYLPSFVLVVLRTVSASMAVLMPLHLWGPAREGSAPQVSTILGGASAAVLPLVIEYLLRRMVAQPQPALSGDLLAADDAIRSSSIHAVAGAGACACLLLLGTFSAVTGMTSAITALRWLLPAFGAIAFAGGVAMWLTVGLTASWKVRRNLGSLGTQP